MSMCHLNTLAQHFGSLIEHSFASEVVECFPFRSPFWSNRALAPWLYDSRG